MFGRYLKTLVQQRINPDKINKLIKKSKNMQYRSLVEENNNQPSNVWKIFKDLGATKNKSNCTTDTIFVRGGTKKVCALMLQLFNDLRY